MPTVAPYPISVPGPLSPLLDLAWNLWWSWNAPAERLWEQIDPQHWEQVRHNPVAQLADAPPERLEALAADPDYLRLVGELAAAQAAYLGATDTWAHQHVPELAVGRGYGRICYFTMEFGLHEALRLYSGGLGVLSGDHCRSASDLGLDFVGVSLLYRQGYFRQVVDDGQQLAAYPRVDFERIPVRQVLGDDGRPLLVAVPHGHSEFTCRVWRLEVGRAHIYLLDADHDGNSFERRYYTHRLYGGDERTRISQEIILGVGGVRALSALGCDPEVVHLNEGHCAFAPVEMTRRRVLRGEPLLAALNKVRSLCVFTTHTPVPAGHDRFSWDVVNEALVGYREGAGWPEGTIMDLGRVRPSDLHEPMCMTVLALKLSRAANGVSELHGQVSRQMWRELYPMAPTVDAVPIGHVTNGVHPTFWMSPCFMRLFDAHLPGWRGAFTEPEFWQQMDDALPDEALWEACCELRAGLVRAVRRQVHPEALDPDTLTVGFARRFAPYKRANLLFTEPERLEALVRGERPIQVVYSGKAHPRDMHGQALLAEVVRWTRQPRFRNKVVFMEDYDIVGGRLLTSGVDVWLNTPRRPREASGTSGQKVPLNGGLNASVLDGWWPEAFDGTNGWAIGETRDYETVEDQDAADAESLYQLLEGAIRAEFHDRDSGGLPHAWLRRVKASMRTCIPRFNTHRMVADYALGYYRA